MTLLLGYILQAFKLNLIDEWHVWDYARNEQDRNWLSSLPERSNRIKFISHEDMRNELWKRQQRAFKNWEAHYSHYNLDNYPEKTVLIKCDDDIVYIDLSKLKDFINFRIENPQYFLVSANVVNNSITSGVQQFYGAFSKDIDPPDGLRKEYPFGKLWSRGDIATKLHYYFIDNVKKFPKNSYYEQPIGEKISIHFISYLGKDFIYTKDIDVMDDEGMISGDMPIKTNRKNVVDLRFVVSHLSYGPQEKNFNKDDILLKYFYLLTDSIY